MKTWMRKRIVLLVLVICMAYLIVQCFAEIARAVRSRKSFYSQSPGHHHEVSKEKPEERVLSFTAAANGATSSGAITADVPARSFDANAPEACFNNDPSVLSVGDKEAAGTVVAELCD